MKAIFSAFCLTVFSAVALGAGNVPNSKAERSAAEIQHRTQAALKLRLAGDNEAATAALKQLVSEFPDAPLPHWAIGEVWTDEKWLPFDRVVHEQGRWPELYKYQQEREKRSEDNFRDQLFLADGCKAHGLVDEERAHLVRTLMLDYGFQEGHLRLGHVNVGGIWITPRQIQSAYRQMQRDQANLAAWQDRIQLLQRNFAKAQPETARERQVVEELNAIRTPDAIPALERYFASRGERELAAYQQWLARIDSHEAARALVRQAVLLDNPRLRTKAQQLLQERRYEQYVPALLSALETVEERFGLEVDVSSLIAFRVHRELVVNDQDFELNLESTQTLVPSDVPLPVRPGSTIVLNPRLQQATARQLLEGLSAWYQATISNTFGLDSASARQELRTSRARRALEVATQVEGNQSDQDWWAWWRNQNDSVLQGGRAAVSSRYDQIWYVDRRGPVPVSGISMIPMRFDRQRHSCFAPGTLVETEHGLRKIEEVRVGDRVLSQDVETGELQFKPVFATTRRERASLVVLKTSSEEITCSIGHPFWVAGKGWRMVKELKPGMQLYTLDGRLVDVQDIQEVGTGTVHNVIVADFSTYFAGSMRFFTHDVTPRDATDAVLPGLRKEYH